MIVLCCRRPGDWCGTWWNVTLESFNLRQAHEENCKK